MNARATWSTRGRWTTDASWHAYAIGSLVVAIAWFEVGAAIAVGRVLALGATPAAWSISAVGGPLVAGWIGLAILGSATHLLPAVGPGDAAAHAQQRQLLGRVAVPRLVLVNVGVACLSIGWPLSIDDVVLLGTAMLAIGLTSTAALLAGAVRIGITRRVAIH
jgi:hypothetical protein